MAAAEAAALFASCGLEPKTAANVASNAKVSAALREMLADAGVLGGCDKSVGNLLYSAATRVRRRCSCGVAARRARLHARNCALTCARLRRSFPATRWRTASCWRATSCAARSRRVAAARGAALRAGGASALAALVSVGARSRRRPPRPPRAQGTNQLDGALAYLTTLSDQAPEVAALEARATAALLCLGCEKPALTRVLTPAARLLRAWAWW